MLWLAYFGVYLCYGVLILCYIMVCYIMAYFKAMKELVSWLNHIETIVQAIRLVHVMVSS